MVPKILPRFIPGFFSQFVSYLAGKFLSLLNWNMESAKALSAIQSRTLIVHHPQDELMHGQASLYNKIFQRGTTVPQNISHLDLSRSPSRCSFFHAYPLENFATDEFDPTQEIVQFLFASQLPSSG